MKRTFNFTGRSKIARNEVRFRLTDDGRSYFVSVAADLSDLPADAQVVAEAYDRTSYERQRLGSVGGELGEGPYPLGGVPSDTALFRLKVVSEEGADSGLLLAVADEIRPTDASGHGGEDSKWESIPLLHLRPAELDGLLWRVDLTGSWPMLEYEESVPDNRLEHFVRGQLFRSLVMPEVVRQILTKLVVEEHDLDREEGTWQAGWIDLGREWAGDDPPMRTTKKP